MDHETEATLAIQEHLAAIVKARLLTPQAPVIKVTRDGLQSAAIGYLYPIAGRDSAGYQLYIVIDIDQPKSWSVIFSAWDVESIGPMHESITLREV